MNRPIAVLGATFTSVAFGMWQESVLACLFMVWLLMTLTFIKSIE